jgi:lysozyme family protein
MAKFEDAIDWILGHEGGYNPNDPSMYGITYKTAEDYGYTGNIEDLDLQTAKDIYATEYWNFDGVNGQAVATKILDICVNMGVSGGTKVLQETLNDLGQSVAVDGKFGPKTLSAVNAVDGSVLLQALAARQAIRYQEIVNANPAKAGYLDGWLKRASDLPTSIKVGGGIGIALVIAALVLFGLKKGKK